MLHHIRGKQKRHIKVTPNAKPLSSCKQGSELYFSYLRFQYEHTMAKQETIVQIFLG